jgi:hypothetical protein
MRITGTLLIALGLLAGCAGRQPRPESRASNAYAYQRYQLCASEVRSEHAPLIEPERPRPPATSRVRAPDAWRDYERELVRYDHEYRRYAEAKRIMDDKIALRCGMRS